MYWLHSKVLPTVPRVSGVATASTANNNNNNDNNNNDTNNNKKAQLSLTNPRDACEKFARFT